MRMSTPRALLTLAALALLAPAGLAAQDRAVVSNEVSVGRSEATLRLEFADQGELTVSLRNGTILIDDHTVGSYRPGGRLDAAWRSLLGKAVSLDDGALARELRGWRPPGGLTGNQADGATAVATALDTALAPPVQKRADGPAAATRRQRTLDTTGLSQVRALLERSDRLADLGVALRDVDVSDARIRIDEDVDVQAGDTLEGPLVVVDGNAKIAGTVKGDVVVVGGSLRLLPGGEVDGDVRLADASVSREGGTVEGELTRVSGAGRGASNEMAGRIRQQVEQETEGAARARHSFGSSLFAPVRRVVGGLGGLIQNLFTILVLGLAGAGVAVFAGPRLDAVADTARRSPGRAAAVGLAGSFLLVPVWLLGIVVLTVSIVGIPVMIAWLPLFPLAAAAAGVLGYLAVAHNVGQWLAQSDFRFTDRIRASNPIHTVVAGLVALIGAFMIGNVVSMVPFFGFVRGLLVFLGVIVTIAAAEIGFGAVLLTRAGTRPQYGFGEAAWDADVQDSTSRSPAGEGGGATEGGSHA